jgi:hypothetical protein
MTADNNILGTLFVAILLPVSFLVVNPYSAMKISKIDEQTMDIRGRISFCGKPAQASRIVDANAFVFSTDKTGTASARIEFSAPVDLYKNSIALFIRCRQSDEMLRLTLTDSNSFTSVYNVVDPVIAGRRWTKVLIGDKGLAGVLNIDKSKISAIRLTSEKTVRGQARVIEIKNIALRGAERYNQ